MIKICGKIISHFVHSVIIFSGAIFITANTDIGRRGICKILSTSLSKYNDNYILLSGWDGGNFVKNFTYKTNDGTSINLQKIKFNFQEKFNISIEKIDLKTSGKNSDLRKILDNIVTIINTFREYINQCNIGTITYNTSDFSCDDIHVKNGVDFLSISGKKDDGFFACDLRFVKNKIDSVNLQLDKLSNINGKIIVENCLQSEAKLIANLERDGNIFSLNGKFEDFTKSIFCHGSLTKNDKFLTKFGGQICLNDKIASGKILLTSPDLDRVFCQNDKKSTLEINGKFAFGGKIDTNFLLNDGNFDITNGQISGDKIYTIKGQILNNSICNIRANNYEFCINSETKSANFKLLGKSWNAYADAIFDNTEAIIKNLSFFHENCDIKTIEPIFIKDKNIDSGRVSIDCRDVKFLSDVIDTEWIQDASGAFTGNLYVSDNYKILDILTDKISLKKLDIYGAKFKYKDGNFWANSNGFEFKNKMFNDFEMSVVDGKILAKCDIDTDGNFSLNGQTKDGKIYTFNYIKFSTKNINFVIKNLNLAYTYKNTFSCLCDNISICEGKAKIDCNFAPDSLKLALHLNKIPCKLISSFDKIIDGKIIDGLFLSGDIDLNEKQKILTGKIQTKISDKNTDLITINGQLKDDGLNLKANYSRLDNKIDISGCIPVCYSIQDRIIKNLPNELKIRCNTNLDLKNIFAISDDFSLTGQLKSNLDVKGSLSKPLLNGTMNFTNGTVETSAVSVKNIILEVSSKNNQIDIKRCIANDKNGKMEIIGKAKLDTSKDLPKLILDSNVLFSNFELVNSEALKLTFDGKIKANGPIENLLLSGPLTLTKGIYDSSTVTKNLHSDIRIIRAGKRPKQLTKERKKVNIPFVFDIDADCKTLKVVGESIESKFSGPIKVVTYNDELSMDGAFNLKNGYIKLLGIRVPIRKGKILFKKDKPLSPEVSLLGNTFVRDMQVFIDVNNKNADKLSINIYSKPSYSIDNILSKIIFNKPSQELRIEESTKIHEAINNLTHQESAFSLFDALKDLMFFDTVSISSEQTTSTKNDNHTISAGKYLNNNIYVGVDKTTEKEAKYKVRVNLSPQITVEANSVGEAGVSWVYRY